MKDSSEYIMPVFAVSGVDGAGHTQRRFVGSCFLVESPNTVVTCRHVLEPLMDGYDFYVHHFKTVSWHKVSDIWFHPKADIAVASVPNFGAKVMVPFAGSLTLGGDVAVFAYQGDATDDGSFALLPSVSKGHIVSQPVGLVNLMAGFGIYMLSFPSLPGFSGAPVEVFGSDHFVGMLFNNKQTEVTVFSHEEVQNGGLVWKERVARVQEYGLMIGYGEVLAALKMRTNAASI
jgi:hypothetical protein